MDMVSTKSKRKYTEIFTFSERKIDSSHELLLTERHPPLLRCVSDNRAWNHLRDNEAVEQQGANTWGRNFDLMDN